MHGREVILLYSNMKKLVVVKENFFLHLASTVECGQRVN